MPSHTDTAGHTKALIYPVMDNLGESEGVQFSGARQMRTDNLSVHSPIR